MAIVLYFVCSNMSVVCKNLMYLLLERMPSSNDVDNWEPTSTCLSNHLDFFRRLGGLFDWSQDYSKHLVPLLMKLDRGVVNVRGRNPLHLVLIWMQERLLMIHCLFDFGKFFKTNSLSYIGPIWSRSEYIFKKLFHRIVWLICYFSFWL